MAGPKTRKKLKPRRKIPEIEFGGAKVGVYMKPLDTKSNKNLRQKLKQKGPQPWRTAKKDRENNLRDKRAKLRAKQRIKK